LVEAFLAADGLARLDLIVCFSQQGTWFVCRAAPVMLMLNLLRGSCAVYGMHEDHYAASAGQDQKYGRSGNPAIGRGSAR
jgi:hypothetical protein